MIINISGTYGSGKSTAVKNVMRCYDEIEKVFVEGRRQPFGYICHKDDTTQLYVPGHYETPCGGCDTLSTFPKMLDLIYAVIRKHGIEEGRHVLYEGSLIESDVRRAAELSEVAPFRLVSLNVPLEECLDSVRKRREARGNFKPLKPKNTIDRFRMVQRRNKRLTDAGANTIFANREEAVAICLEEFGLVEPKAGA